MRKAGILLTMIFWVAHAHGAGLGSQAAQASEQGASRSPEIQPDRNEQVQSQKGDASGKLNQNQKSPIASTGSVHKHPSATKVKPAGRPSRSVKMQASKSLQTSTPANVPDFHPTTTSTPTVIPNETVGRRGAPTQSATVALNGQRFINSRAPGARLAVSGGPQNSTHGTVAINGSNVKRKP
jgi:hypothetical protein